MKTRKNANKIARVSVMSDSQKRKHHGLLELQRNIHTKYVLQNIIKHNTESN